jgi:protein-L-isoaspartate(D-aspartate) O-methyltransferase
VDAEIDLRIQRLVGRIGADDTIGEVVKQAIRAVPRHLFIPDVALATPGDAQPYVIDREADPGAWWDAVYSMMPIVTQLDDGATPIRAVSGDYTSSASAPSTVADLLQLLDVKPGHRVLEVGTGTGWTAALLSRLVGEGGAVTSVEVDDAVAEQAAKNLTAAGAAQPRLLVDDGANGYVGGSPYDRVHVTCGIRDVPYAWIEQARPGAVIVLPYCPGFGDNHSLRLRVMPGGTAIGRFPGGADYMLMRSQRVPGDRAARGPEDKHYLTTSVDPRTIGHAPAGADLTIAALTGLVSYGSAMVDEDGELYRMWAGGRSGRRWSTLTFGGLVGGNLISAGSG